MRVCIHVYAIDTLLYDLSGGYYCFSHYVNLVNKGKKFDNYPDVANEYNFYQLGKIANIVTLAFPFGKFRSAK